MINLIDQQSQLNLELTTYPTANLTLSIFGTQASGKSTLLNEVFATQFPVLDASTSRGRCTKGIWFYHIQNMNIIDTEGFDSAERSEDDKLFEKQMSLFCVVISDIILVNVSMNEIGRYSGGHIDILEAIFKVGERLVTPQQKRLIYIIRDCTDDADHRILIDELSKELKQITNKYNNKQLKFTFDYFFMSHYVYQPEQFILEAKKLLPMISIKKPSPINNYKEADRVKYLRQLWNKIRDAENQLDLKSIDDALKNYVMERIKNEALVNLEKLLENLTTLGQAKTFDRYIEILKRDSLAYLTENRPKHIKQSELEDFNLKLIEQFEPTAIKHFNNFVIKNAEEQLEQQLLNQIQKQKNNKKLSHLIFKKKKEVTDIYKKVINNHKEYPFLIRRFHEKTAEIISKEERNLSHLFSLFQTEAEMELNKIINQQAQNLLFKKEKVNQKIKAICQQFQYNQWEVDFKQIWERVSYRCIQKLIPQIIEETSANSGRDFGCFVGDQTTNIIAYHTNIEKKALDFCRDILEFLHDENTLTQPLSQVKEIVRQCLNKRLIDEQRRWKISMLVISLLMLLLYGELQSLLGWASIKKKKRKVYMRIYFWTSVFVLCFSVMKRFSQK